MVLLLLIGLSVGLSACRGFFGQPPIALLEILVPADDEEAPVTVTFDMSGSNDPDGVIVSYELDYGDLSSPVTGVDVADARSHAYSEGTYTATLTVTDNDGRIAMDSDTITIGPAMITFASDRGGDYGIYRMRADGSLLGAVLDVSGTEEFFPDLLRETRDRIAYCSDALGNWDIYTMSVTGGSISPLVTQTASEIQPSWVRDGSKIAYAAGVQTPSDTWEIWTLSLVGGIPNQLTSQSGSWAVAPAYSPTGDNLLFVSDAGTTGGSAIWLWDDLTSSASLLYDSGGRDGDASPAGFGGLALGLPSGVGISKPAWSPDGSKIAFATDQDGSIDIYVMNANGTGDESLETYVNGRLSSPVTVGTVTSSAADEFCPYWLEDGSGLIFSRESGGVYALYKVAFETGDVTPLTALGNNVTPTAEGRGK
jgi:PKD repeat protein